MRGSIKRRYKGSWSVILELGYQVDPATGKPKRKQKWLTFKGNRKAAESFLTEQLRAVNRNEFVEPSKTTLAEWLREWLDKAIKPPLKTQRAYDRYKQIIEKQIIPVLGTLRLQAVKSLDLEGYYAKKAEKLKPATLQIHHAILHSALDAAVKGGMVTRNVAQLVSNKPTKPTPQDVLDHVWTADEAAKFLKAAKAAGPQPAAFYTLALDTGARRGELAALRWSDLDMASGRLTIQRTLYKGGAEPVFGATKTKTTRTVELAGNTIALLKAHRAHQAEIKLKNRTAYTDNGLIFAKEWEDVKGHEDSLGAPLQVNNIAQREYDKLITAAGIRRIKFHGMRHSTATLMLAAGVPPHVVQRRLGHAKVEMTLTHYAHALPEQQRGAADQLAAMLHG